MALVKLGPIVADIRGSIGGTVFARNRGGAYARARVAPLNPASPRQVSVRAILGDLAQRWASALSDVQRAAWELYAENVPLVNALGESRNVSGQNMYVRSNSLLLDTGNARVDDAPVVFSVGPTITPTLTFGVVSDSVTITDLGGYDPDTDGPINILLAQGNPVSSGVNFYKAPFQKVLGQNVPTTATLPIGPTTMPKPINAGQALFMRTANVTPDGRVGQPVIQRFPLA